MNDKLCMDTFIAPKSVFYRIMILSDTDQSTALALLQQFKELRKVCNQENCFGCPGNIWKGKRSIKCTGSIPVTIDEVDVRVK